MQLNCPHDVGVIYDFSRDSPDLVVNALSSPIGMGFTWVPERLKIVPLLLPQPLEG